MNEGVKDLIIIVIWLVSMFAFAIPLFNKDYAYISKETLPYFVGLLINGIVLVILTKDRR